MSSSAAQSAIVGAPKSNSEVFGPSLTTGRRRMDYLDGIRAIAAVYVVWRHLCATLGADDGFQRIVAWTPDPHYAVVMFIVLSGFCLALPTLKNGFRLPSGLMSFYKRRARRILPPYYTALALSVILGVTVLSQATGNAWDISLPVTFKSVLTHAFLIHNVTGDNARIDYPMWSVAVECQIYLLFPVLLWISRRFGMVQLCILAACITYPITFFLRHSVLYDLKPHFVFFFCLGIFAASTVCEESQTSTSRKRKVRSLLILISVTVLGALAIIGAEEGGYFVARYGPYLAFFASIACCGLLIGIGGVRGGILRRMLESRSLVGLGRMSYSLYLIHAPLLQMGWLLVRRAGVSTVWQWVIMSGPVFAGIVGLSAVFYFFIERPFVRSFRSVRGPSIQGVPALATSQW